MAALLVGLSVMAVVMSVALPVWQTAARREREAELLFRGEQYARAIALYQRSRGGFPPNLDVLVNERFLRKKYRDPMAADGEFQVIYVGQAMPGQADDPRAASGGRGRQAGPAAGQTGRGALERPAQETGGLPTSGFAAQTGPGAGAILGVVSKSTQTSLREYNGRTRYNEWAFVAVQASQEGGTATPTGGRGGQPPDGGAGRGGRGGQAPRGIGRGVSSGAERLGAPGPGLGR
jgi:type II secretory pathway pseudopilin PulG